MREQKLRIKDVLQGESRGLASIITAGETAPVEDDFASDLCTVHATDVEIPVNYLDVETIVLPEIRDVHGRISDIVNAIEISTGIAVVPFEMASIAPEITKLQRHEIFELGDRRFAMAKEVRDGVISQYVSKITRTLTSGIPFVENLSTTVTYNNQVYSTLSLSRIEWTTLLSKFRGYKHSLKIQDGSKLILEILAERA